LKSNNKTIVFRCDFGSKFGLGHLMRCIALSEEFQKYSYIHTVCLTNHYDEKYDELLSQTAMHMIVFPENTIGLAFNLEDYISDPASSVTLFDNYNVTFEQMNEYKKKYQNLVAIDDLADRKFDVDLIINQNINAENLNYKIYQDVKLLLGSKFVLLRKCILNAGENRIKNQVFMSFGGGDIFSRIETLLKMFHEINKKLVNTVHIDFAISSEQALMVYPLLEVLDKIKFNYISNSYDLSSSIARADFAITAAGTTVFELAYLGVPQITLIIDENQRVTGEEINNKGIGLCLGDIDKILCSDFVGCFFEFLTNDVMKEKMSSRARTFINGEGAKEVVGELIKSYNLAA